MSGKERSYTQQKLDTYIEELDTQIKSMLPIKNPLTSEVTTALNLTFEQLKIIPPTECAILSYKLALYSTYLQLMGNRYKSIRRWAENNINMIVAKEGGNYGDKWTKYEERKYCVIAGNEYARALNDIWVKYGGLEEDMSEIANKVRYMAQTIQEMKNVK